MGQRIAIFIGAIVCGAVLPWWLFFIIAAGIAYLHAPWYEGIAVGLFLDLVFSIPREQFHNFLFVYTIAIMILLVVANILNRYVRSLRLI